METHDLVMRFARAVRDDAELDAWSRGRYGVPVSVFVGYDTRNPPEESVLVLFTGWSEEGEGIKRTALFTVGWSVRQEAVDEEGNLHVYRGGTEADELGRRVWEVLDRAGKEHFLSRETRDMNVWDFFPYFAGRMEVVARLL